MAVTMPGQLDLLAEIEAEEARANLTGAPMTGLAYRQAAFTAWEAEHGHVGSYDRYDGFRPQITAPDTGTERCEPTVLTAHRNHKLLYRGCCRACPWEGPDRDTENAAVEDVHDHCWPGWRDLPIMPGKPYEGGALARWLDKAKRLYPAGWVEGGGPIRTARKPGLTRSHHAHEWGGFDIGVVVSAAGEQG